MIDRRLVPVLAIFAAACSAPTSDDSATAGDADRQLNEAAAMLDANSVDANLVSGDQPVARK